MTGSVSNVSLQPSRSLLIASGIAVAACGLLFSIPQPSIRVNQPFKIEFLFAICLIAFAFFCFRSYRTIFTSPDHIVAPISIGIGAFVVWSTLSALWSSSAAGVTHHSLLWSAYLLTFLIFSGLIRRDASVRLPFQIFLIISLLLGVLSVTDYLTTPDFAANEGPLRIRYGKYAEMLVTLLPIVWASAIYVRRQRVKVVVMAAGALGWLTVMLSLSKGVFIAGVIGFVLFFVCSLVFSPRVFRKKVALTAAFWLILTIGTQALFTAFSAVPSTTDYIGNSTTNAGSTTAMRIFTWNVGRQMAGGHLLTGVGADNFGLAFNEARKSYRLQNPDNPTDEVAEDYLVERAHNEPLQVLAELGIPGLILFVFPFGIFCYFFVRKLARDRFRISPVAWAAAAGMSAFAVSSMVSSFSFRSAQNGAVFFIVMAIAVREITKHPAKTKVARRASYSATAYLFTWFTALALGVFCVFKIAAEYHAYQADRAGTLAESEEHFRLAIGFDREYAGAYLAHAGRTSQENEPARSAKLYRYAISNGIGTAPTYASLAKQETLANVQNEADASYRESIAIYPRSVFLRISYAVFLENQGRVPDATAQRAAAILINRRQANGWYELIRNGSMAALGRSLTDKTVAPPAELMPESAVRQFLDKFPDGQ